MDELLQWQLFRLVDKRILENIRLAFVWTWNQQGQSAVYVDHNNDVRKITMEFKDYRIKSVEYKIFCGKKILSFERGADHIVALTADGKVFGWGKNHAGQLGDGTVIDRQTFVLNTEFSAHTITQVAVSSQRTFGLTDKGVVVWCGAGKDGLTSSKITDVVSIKAGANVFLCLTKDGKVYEMVDTLNQNELICVVQLPPVVQIARGASFSMALTERGKIYAWGENSKGELGNGKIGSGNTRGFGYATSTTVHTEKLPVAVLLPNNLRFAEIATHGLSRTVAARAVNGTIYVWGDCDGKCKTVPTEIGLNRLDTVFSVIDRPIRCLRDIKVLSRPSISAALFNQPSQSDCTFLVEGRPIYASKSILKLRLEYFEKMFNEAWKETSGAVNITGYAYATYYTFLKFLYTGDETVINGEKWETLLELLRLAHQVQYEVLLDHCIEVLERKLSYESVCEVYDVAKTLEISSLIDKCCRLARTDVLTVFRSEAYAQMSPGVRSEFTFCVVGNPHVTQPGGSGEGSISEEESGEQEVKRQRLDDD